MRPHLNDTSLQRRGDFRVPVLTIGHFAGQTEVLLHTAIIHEAGFDTRTGVMRYGPVFAVRRGGSIRVGRLLSLPTGREPQQCHHEHRNHGLVKRPHHEAISWPTADSSWSTFR